jgi:hypothetical protein
MANYSPCGVGHMREVLAGMVWGIQCKSREFYSKYPCTAPAAQCLIYRTINIIARALALPGQQIAY